MTDFPAGIGRTDPMCSLHSFSDAVLSPATAKTQSMDQIRTMFEHLVASMARIEARMEARLEATERCAAVAQPPPRPDPDPPYAEWQRGREDSGLQSAVLTQATAVSSISQLGFGGGISSHGPQSTGLPGGSAWDRYGVSAGMTPGRQTTAWDNPAHRMDNRAGRHVPASGIAWDRLDAGPYSDLQRFDRGRLDQPRFDHYRQDRRAAIAHPPPRPDPDPPYHDWQRGSGDAGYHRPWLTTATSVEVRPLDAKPVEETPKSNRKAKSKPAADPVTPGKSAAASKRLAEDTASTVAKKPKKSPAAEPETAEKKSNGFQRLWSEEDEIVILEGMIEFQNKFQVDPWANLDDEGRRSAVRCAFDPGGDVSQQFLAINSRRCFVVSTLRTRWISTVGELIRADIWEYPSYRYLVI